MTLTKQWKKGELEDGCYYVRTDNGIENWEYIYTHLGFGYCEDKIKEVLAPVPSYEEWQKMKEQRDTCVWALDKIGDVLVKHKLVKKIDEVLK